MVRLIHQKDHQRRTATLDCEVEVRSAMATETALSKGRLQQPTTMVGAVTLSVIGMAVHTVREFGYSGLLAGGTGFAPIALVQLLLLLSWWSVPRWRPRTAVWLAATGIFQLIGGAIMSVLPLPFLPFMPEQSVAHYLSHLVLGLTQLPLIVFGLRQSRLAREAATEAEKSASASPPSTTKPIPARPDV